ERSREKATEAELDKKKRELEEQRAQLADLKTQLKEAKRKLYEQKEADKTGGDLVKARAEVERTASTQLEVVRSELSMALADLAKLRAEAESRGGKRAAAAPASEPRHEAPAVQKVIRELSDADREKITRAEQQSAKDKAKASDLEREATRLKGRPETEKRVYTVTR